MEQKHTQGDWTIRRAKTPDNTGGYDYAVLDKDGAVIGEAFEHVGKLGTSYDVRPAKANATMFAAAPDLLEACQSILEHWASGNFSRGQELWAKLKSAIAKAEGR